MRSDVTGGIVKLVTAKLQNSDLGSSIAHMATEHVMEKTRNSLAGRLGAEMFIQPLAQPIEKILAKHINEILQNNSQQMIQDLVNKEAITRVDGDLLYVDDIELPISRKYKDAVLKACSVS